MCDCSDCEEERTRRIKPIECECRQCEKKNRCTRHIEKKKRCYKEHYCQEQRIVEQCKERNDKNEKIIIITIS